MITTIYKNENQDKCVDICEVLYHILNQFYSFTESIIIHNDDDIHNLNSLTGTLFADVSNYTNNLLHLLQRLNLEVFINPSITIVTVIPVTLLEFIRESNLNVEVEYVPKILTLADTIIEIEEELAIIIFNSKEVI
ncbi:TPA: hypothetical protein ACG3IS_003744 [Clostridioides difficile]